MATPVFPLRSKRASRWLWVAKLITVQVFAFGHRLENLYVTPSDVRPCRWFGTLQKPIRSQGSGGQEHAIGFDAARKIAQGLGARLEDLVHVVEVKGETARLLPVSERARYLFGKEQEDGKKAKSQRLKVKQMDLFEELVDDAQSASGKSAEKASAFSLQHSAFSVLDRVHQSMILFAAGRSEAMKRFLVEDGAGQDQRFWRLV